MKKYIVRLSTEEKLILEELIKKLKGGSQKAMRAKILLKADANGPNWNDEKIAEAYGIQVRTIENVRKRLVTVWVFGGYIRIVVAIFFIYASRENT